MVADASVAVKWLFTEEHSDQARAMLRAAHDGTEIIVAPPLLPFEVANTIRQRMRRESVSLQQAQLLLATFLALPINLRAPATLHERALEISARHSLPAVYDVHYVALAELSGCVLWTDDQRLLIAVRGSLTFVRPIAEYGAT